MKASGEDGEAPAGGPWEECFEAAVQLALRAGQVRVKNITDHCGMATHQSEWMLVLHRLDADQVDVSPGHSYALSRMLAMPRPISFYSFVTTQCIR